MGGPVPHWVDHGVVAGNTRGHAADTSNNPMINGGAADGPEGRAYTSTTISPPDSCTGWTRIGAAPDVEAPSRHRYA